MRNKQEQKQWEMQAYGMTKEDMENEFAQSLVPDSSFYAICILSDVQEILESIKRTEDFQDIDMNAEHARKLINKAKYMINRNKYEKAS